VKWQTTPQFSADWKRLNVEYQRLFRSALADFSKACDRYVADPGSASWPAKLRVSPMKSAPGIWEMTWSFSGPDGRATFEFITESGDERVRWRRIGDHAIYRDP
jgi:hypothetical protein